MQSNTLPVGVSRIRFLMLTMALPMLLGYFMVILGVLTDAIGPRDITYQTVHSVDLISPIPQPAVSGYETPLRDDAPAEHAGGGTWASMSCSSNTGCR